ncbi:MAG: tetraacyldisaccharide 4'-kinase [Bdellovibrionota bacterium]
MGIQLLYSGLSPLWALTNSFARVLSKSRAERLPRPVISVGNIVAGGVGKTEIIRALASRFVEQGRRVVVASRGYGSPWEKTGGVSHDFASGQAHHFPDEANLLLKRIPGISVVVGAKRSAILKRFWEEIDPDIVLLDDGFQHFGLARDLDVLVHDFSIRWPVLRDFPIHLDKARLRVSFSEVPERWKIHRKGCSPWVRAQYRVNGIVDAFDKKMPLPPSALVFCGLGNPHRFREGLKQVKVEVKDFRSFSDHQNYTREDIKKLVQWKKGSTDAALLTSLKDYVKLYPFIESQGGVPGFEPCWVDSSVVFLENEEYFWNTVTQALSTSKHS